MAEKVGTIVNNIDRIVSNEQDVEIITRFFEFMKKIGTSERYQNNNDIVRLEI